MTQSDELETELPEDCCEQKCTKSCTESPQNPVVWICNEDDAVEPAM